MLPNPIPHARLSASSGASRPGIVLALVLVLGLGTTLDARPAGAQTQPSRSTPGEAGDPDSARPDPDEDEEEEEFYLPPPGIEEIVVRAGDTTTLETDIPTSATTFDESELAVLGVQDIGDIAVVTPNLQINTVSGTTPTFFIRGVGLADFNANATGAVAIYQGGAPINAPALQLPFLFDSQVAVLKGPIPYGNFRNASAGVISMVPNRPTGDLIAKVRADYGNFDFKDIEGTIGFPIVGDELSARLAFRFAERDPFYDNRCGNLPEPTQGACGASDGNRIFPRLVPAGLPDEVNDEGRWAARGLLRYQPDLLDMDWVLDLHGASLDHQSPLGQVIGTAVPNVDTSSDYIDPAIERIRDANRALARTEFPDESRPEQNRIAYSRTLDQVTRDISLTEPFDNAYNLVGDEKMDSFGGVLTGDMTFGNVDFQTITGAESYDRSRITDLDFSPDPTFETDIDDNAWQFTQSLQLDSELERIPLTGQAGIYYLMERLDSKTAFTVSFSPSARPRIIDQSYAQSVYSFGPYASLHWDFLEDFTLEGGVRYNCERKVFDLQVQGQSGSNAQTWSAPTGGLSLTYRVNEDVSLYGKYSRGWKSGTFNAAVLANELVGETELVPDITAAEPESVDAFEIGASGRFFDGTLELKGAFFYYKYDDYQVFVLQTTAAAPPQFEIINANDAQIYGAELELFAEPLVGRVPELLEGLSLVGRFSWLESEFLDFTRQIEQPVGGALLTRTVDFSGNRLPNTPRFKASGSVTWTFPIGRWGAIIPHYDFSYTDDVFFDPSEGRGTPPLLSPAGVPTSLPLSDFAIGQPAYWLHNARLTYRLPGDMIEISGWVRNFTDTRYKTYVADATQTFQSLINWIGDPRTFGGSISLRY